MLGRRNTTVPESYNVDQSAAEKEGRLEQVTVGKLLVYLLKLNAEILQVKQKICLFW